jgi:hypothetical protein
MPDRSHKIAAKQAELARRKHRHHEQQAPGQQAAHDHEAVTDGTHHLGASGGAVGTTEQEAPHTKPSLLSSYQAISGQADASQRNRPRGSQAQTQAEFFASDLRRLSLTLGFCLAILIALTFVLR